MRRLSFSRRAVLLVALLASLVAAGVLLAQDDDAEDTRPAGPLTGTITYTLQAGDVLDLIAARYDVSVACLIEMNAIENVFRMFPGDTITISAECPLYDGFAPVTFPRAARDVQVTPQPGGDQGGSTVAPVGPGEAVYIVQVADVLDLIAAAFNEDLECIVERNGFPFIYGPIYPGDPVIVPSNCPPYTGLSTPLLRGPGPQPADVEAAWGRSGSAAQTDTTGAGTTTEGVGGGAPEATADAAAATEEATATEIVATPNATTIALTLMPVPTLEAMPTEQPLVPPQQQPAVTPEAGAQG